MKGKIGLVVGLGVGYVLGTRAGRERYEQIKTQWLKVWHLDPVQAQVTRAQDFAKSQAAAIPGALWNGAVKVVKAASETGTPGERFEHAVDAAKDAAGDVADAAEDATEGVQKRAAAAKTAAAKKSSTASKSSAATKSSPKKNGS